MRPAPRLGEPAPIGGIDYRWLFAGAAAGVTRWRCGATDTRRGAERLQPAHVVVFVHAGSFRVHRAAGEALADPGRAVFLEPGRPYETSHPGGCGDRGSAIALAEDVARELLAARGAGPRGFGADGPIEARVALAQHRLLGALERRGPLDALEAEERALSVAAGALAAAAGRLPRRRATAARRAAAERIRELLAADFALPLRLPDVARRAGVSTFHACRVFREAWGVPIHRHLNALRLRVALAALSDGRTDLAGVALDAGFSSHSHFSAAFRKEFGVAPSAGRPLALSRARS